MITEQIEVWALEEGDVLYIQEQTFYLQAIEGADNDHSILWLVDDEGFQRSIALSDSDLVRMVVEDV